METGGMTGAIELGVLAMSSGRVVWEDVLYSILAMVPDGDKTGVFRLKPLLTSEYRVPLFSQEVQTSRSENQFVVQ